ncbi:MAG: hypothetical protein H0U52_07375 [Chloroflexi bacterium]|nr:hypothetical protein [Chloroflexota bacterium]
MAHQAYVSPGGKAWMKTCHPQQDVLAGIYVDLIFHIHHVQIQGRFYGASAGEPIKKLQGFENLWESRVRHRAGQARQFFRFVTIAGERAAIFVDGTAKKGRLLSRHVLEAANARLDAYQVELERQPASRERDLIPTDRT